MIVPMANAYIASGARPAVPAARLEGTTPVQEPGEATAIAPTQDDTSPEVQRQIAELARRDREVRNHEQAHISAGAGLITSGPNYSYTTGPDNRRYATGGEVGIDTSEVRGDPEATLAKAQQIRAAALAPADPSSQDRRVAARASTLEQQARLDIAQRQREEAYAEASGRVTGLARGLLIEERV